MELAKNEKRMFQEFFGSLSYFYKTEAITEVPEYLQNSFNWSFKFSSNKKHRVTFLQDHIILENEYFKMEYINLDPKRERYLTSESELKIITVTQYQPIPKCGLESFAQEK